MVDAKDIISSDILQIEKFTCMQLQWNVVLNRSITSINVLPERWLKEQLRVGSPNETNVDKIYGHISSPHYIK